MGTVFNPIGLVLGLLVDERINDDVGWRRVTNTTSPTIHTTTTNDGSDDDLIR